MMDSFQLKAPPKIDAAFQYLKQCLDASTKNNNPPLTAPLTEPSPCLGRSGISYPFLEFKRDWNLGVLNQEAFLNCHTSATDFYTDCFDTLQQTFIDIPTSKPYRFQPHGATAGGWLRDALLQKVPTPKDLDIYFAVPDIFYSRDRNSKFDPEPPAKHFLELLSKKYQSVEVNLAHRMDTTGSYNGAHIAQVITVNDPRLYRPVDLILCSSHAEIPLLMKHFDFGNCAIAIPLAPYANYTGRALTELLTPYASKYREIFPQIQKFLAQSEFNPISLLLPIHPEPAFIQSKYTKTIELCQDDYTLTQLENSLGYHLPRVREKFPDWPLTISPAAKRSYIDPPGKNPFLPIVEDALIKDTLWHAERLNPSPATPAPAPPARRI